MTQDTHNRRIYLVDPDFQYGLIRKFSIIAVLIIIMALSFLAIVHQLYGNVQIEVVQPDPFAVSGSITTVPAQATLLKLIWPVLLICVAVALVFTFFYGVVISHRMAGPIYRIRKVLDKMAQGDLSTQVHLRKKDDFNALAEGINNLIKSWRRQIEELTRLCRDLETVKGQQQIESLNRFNEILATFKI
jgi:HAMP domain-containing protein